MYDNLLKMKTSDFSGVDHFRKVIENLDTDTEKIKEYCLNCEWLALTDQGFQIWKPYVKNDKNKQKSQNY